MVHGGSCLARLEGGELVLVDGAIPGEVVEVEIGGRRGGTLWGRTSGVLQASAHRVSPPCPYVPECGGCDLQHVAYAPQLTLKRDIVADALRRQKVEVPETVAVHGMADPWRYRWRGEFHVVGDLSQARLGFHRARSWTAIAVDDCLIHHRAITDSLSDLCQVVRRGGRPGLSVLHLTVGEDGAELLVRPKPRHALDLDVLAEVAVHRDRPPRWVTEATTVHSGAHQLRVDPDVFIQVNRLQCEVLYELVRARLGDVAGARIVDAYAGIGALAIALAEQGAAVVCLESNRAAVRLGQLNVRIAGVEDRVIYLAQTVEAALPTVGSPLDAVVLDPPRAGCAGAVTGWLALAGPPRVVYVSCDPATLARDLHVLSACGPYRVERVDVVDMFPQTHHVETVVSLHREAVGDGSRG